MPLDDGALFECVERQAGAHVPKLPCLVDDRQPRFTGRVYELDPGL